MAELKLAKLPDRTPVKITIAVQPELNGALQAYAEAYRATYGDDEKVCDLIPYMIESFLSADRGFAKARKNDGASRATPAKTGRRASTPAATATEK